MAEEIGDCERLIVEPRGLRQPLERALLERALGPQHQPSTGVRSEPLEQERARTARREPAALEACPLAPREADELTAPQSEATPRAAVREEHP